MKLVREMIVKPFIVNMNPNQTNWEELEEKKSKKEWSLGEGSCKLRGDGILTTFIYCFVQTMSVFCQFESVKMMWGFDTWRIVM